jgi:hypothetical protein
MGLEEALMNIEQRYEAGTVIQGFCIKLSSPALPHGKSATKWGNRPNGKNKEDIKWRSSLFLINFYELVICTLRKRFNKKERAIKQAAGLNMPTNLLEPKHQQEVFQPKNYCNSINIQPILLIFASRDLL